MGEICSFLEDILEEADGLTGWGGVMTKFRRIFHEPLGEFWKKSEEKFTGKDFDKKTSRKK